MSYVSIPLNGEDSRDAFPLKSNGIIAVGPALRSEKVLEEKRHRFAFFVAVVTVTAFIIMYEYNNDNVEDKENIVNFAPPSNEQIEKVRESYLNQEKTIEKGNTFDNIESIKANNSYALPSRQFVGLTSMQMCQSGKAGCVQRFARIRPLIVAAPNYRLMSCINQKSMSTVMSAIVCYLFREKEFISEGRSILREMSDIGLCQGENNFKTVDGMLQNLKVENVSDWKFTMVTREPVDRFLSGFIDRCLRVGDPCFGCGNNMTCFLEAEYHRAEDYAFAERMNTKKPHITMEDIHVFPQNWRCNMQKYYNNYEFIRYSSDPSETLLTDLTRVLRAQNVSESSIDYISDSLKSGRTAHSTVTSSSRIFLEQRLKSSPYLMELVVRLFYHDYRLLGYQLPDLDLLDSQTKISTN